MKRESCYFCKGPHFDDACKEFIRLALPERMQFIRTRGLCHWCLRWGHLRKDCRQRKSCATCSGLHPALLHDDALTKDKQDTNGKLSEATIHRIEVSDSKKHAECNSHSPIVPVRLRHKQGPLDKEFIYALLDDQSDAYFIKDTVLENLRINGPQVQLKLSTVLAEEVVTCKKIDGLMKPPAFACQEFTRAEIFQPSEGKSQEQRQHAISPTSYLLRTSLCLTEKISKLGCL